MKRVLKTGMALVMFLYLVLMMPMYSRGITVYAASESEFLLEIEQKTTVPDGWMGIYTVEDLQNIRNFAGAHVSAWKFILMEDIDLSGVDWTPIRCPNSISGYFDSVFDGNGHKIYNMDCTPVDRFGGGLFAQNWGEIKNLYVSGTVTITNGAGTSAGGIANGNMNGSVIRNCVSDVTIIQKGESVSQLDAGGISSWNSGTIEYCRMLGNIEIQRYENQGDYFEGLTAGLEVGGITASGTEGSIFACEMAGNITTTVIYPYNAAIGGIMGTTGGSVGIEQCRATGKIEVSGTLESGNKLHVGGIYGEGMIGTIKDCCFNGIIKESCDGTGEEVHIGGIAGKQDYIFEEFSRCYISGTVSSETPGAILGCVYAGYDNYPFFCYYPQGNNSYGSIHYADDGFVLEGAIDDLKKQSNFEGFDFVSTWYMGENYPVQRVFAGVDHIEIPEPIEPPDESIYTSEDYIKEHLIFAQGEEYFDRMDSRFSGVLKEAMDTPGKLGAEMAYDILDDVNKISMLKFGELSIFENPYDAILAEMLLTMTAADYEDMQTTFDVVQMDIADQLAGIFKSMDPDYDMDVTEIQMNLVDFFTNPVEFKKDAPGIYADFEDFLKQYTSENGAEDILKVISGSYNFFGKGTEFLGMISDAANLLDWAAQCNRYCVVVRSYCSLSDALRSTLHESGNNIDNTYYRDMMTQSLKKLDQYLTEEEIAERFYAEMYGKFSMTLYEIVGAGCMRNAAVKMISEGLNINLGKLNAAVIAYNIGWSLSNTLTGNDKMIEARELMRADYWLAQSVYDIQVEDRIDLINGKKMEDAVAFDASYSILRAVELHILQSYKNYLSASQKSFGQWLLHGGDANSASMEITVTTSEIVKWEVARCHGNLDIHYTMSEITLCTDAVIEVYSDEVLLLEIKDGVITSYSAYAEGAIQGSSCIISLADGFDYDIQLKSPEKSSTLNGVNVVIYDAAGDLLLQENYYTDYSAFSIHKFDVWHLMIDAEGNVMLLDDDADEIEPKISLTAADEIGYAQNISVIMDHRVEVGNYAYLHPVVQGAGVTNRNVCYTSADPEIAIVTNFGRVEGISEGVTKIRVEMMDGSGLYKDVVITVGEKLPFQDVFPDDWFYGSVYYVYQNNIMSGMTERLFEPSGTMNRAMVAAVLYRIEGSPNVVYKNTFKDVLKNQWYTNAILWAYENGIVSGYGNGIFGVQDRITREQLAAMLYRYEKYQGFNVDEAASLARFKDAKSVSSWAEVSLKWAVAEKLISGYADGRLNPQGGAARCECASILQRYLKNKAA